MTGTVEAKCFLTTESLFLQASLYECNIFRTSDTQNSHLSVYNCSFLARLCYGRGVLFMAKYLEAEFQLS